MSDRELLELAAKAAGLKSGEIENNAANSHQTFYVWNDDGKTSRFWNPLADDGDALRLAVKLGLSVCAGTYEVACEFIPQEAGGNICATEQYSNDPYAATRRAITRAAAEIGKAMP